MQKSNGKRGRGKVVNNPLTKNTGNAKREREETRAIKYSTIKMRPNCNRTSNIKIKRKNNHNKNIAITTKWTIKTNKQIHSQINK